ncbi:MAG: penicillin-binding transpeptidase domain-containing protein, partial [Pseudomonadota bacterium]
KSVNTIAVKLAYRSGIKNVKAIAEKAGIVSSIKPYLSMSLGAFEVTPLELTSAYIPFFNGGYGVSPHLVTKITTPDGEILFEQNSNSLNRSERIYSPQTIHHMKDIFHAVTSYGTGRKARLETVPTFGKTGTTSGYKDAWFVGHAGNQNGITAGIWVGNDDYKATDEATGGGVAAILWKNILESYYDIEPHSEPNFIVQDYSKPGPLEQIIQSYDSENQQADTPIAHIIQDHENSSATVVAAQPAIETQKPREYNDAHIESLLLKLER